MGPYSTFIKTSNTELYINQPISHRLSFKVGDKVSGKYAGTSKSDPSDSKGLYKGTVTELIYVPHISSFLNRKTNEVESINEISYRIKLDIPHNFEQRGIITDDIVTRHYDRVFKKIK